MKIHGDPNSPNSDNRKVVTGKYMTDQRAREKNAKVAWGGTDRRAGFGRR